MDSFFFSLPVYAANPWPCCKVDLPLLQCIMIILNKSASKNNRSSTLSPHESCLWAFVCQPACLEPCLRVVPSLLTQEHRSLGARALRRCDVSHKVLGMDRLGGGIWLFSIKNRPWGSFIHFKLWHVWPACFLSFFKYQLACVLLWVVSTLFNSNICNLI